MTRSVVAATWLAACVTLVAAPATPAQMHMLIGTVVHVSVDDIKVKDQKTGKDVTFAIIPHFKKLFSKDGKTTVQMSALTPGTPVTVYYTEVLGVKHADHILINGSVRALKG